MKTTLLSLLSISFLLQSCYSYKTIDLNKTPLEIGQKYKIAEGGKFVKIKVKGVSDTTITVTTENTEKQILLSKKTVIKKRKFSFLKTSLVAIAALSVMIGVSSLNSTSNSGYYSPN